MPLTRHVTYHYYATNVYIRFDAITIITPLSLLFTPLFTLLTLIIIAMPTLIAYFNMPPP